MTANVARELRATVAALLPEQDTAVPRRAGREVTELSSSSGRAAGCLQKGVRGRTECRARCP